MKNKLYQDQDHPNNKHLFQSAFVSQFVPPRTNNPPRDYSIDKNIRRISPAPQERFSHAPNHLVYQLPMLPNNDYQITSRMPEAYSSSDSSKALQDLLTRIQKLQLKSQKIHSLQSKIAQVQGHLTKVQLKIEQTELKKQQYSKGKENTFPSLDNRINDQQVSNRSKCDYVSKDELQKHLIALDTAFKTHLGTFKTVLNTQMSEHNIKNKRKFIEITATQLNQKLELFRNSFTKQWEAQLQIAVRQTWSKQYVGKTAIGLSKDRFIGTVIPLKMRQELSIALEGVSKELQKIETLYFLDKNGYILDKNMFYLLDKNNKEIRLSDEKLQLLKKEGILAAAPKQPLLPKQRLFQGSVVY